MVRRKSGFARTATRGIQTLLLTLFTLPALASVEWLQLQVQPNGSIVTPADIANPHQSTAEAAAALRLAGVTLQVEPAEAFVRGYAYRGTEELSRLILISVARQESTSALVSELLTHQNQDGGFGELQGYDSTPLDTGFALYALYRAGQRQTSQNLAAIDYLQQTQAANGGWSVGTNTPSVYVTARAMQALWQFRQLLPTSIPASQAARQYILAQRQGPAWESSFVTAAALIALAPMQNSQDELAASVAALNSEVLPNGSWNNDVFTTALALQAGLLATSPSANPDLARLRARLVDGETLASLSGVTVRLVAGNSIQRTSNAQGEVDFADLAAGQYSLVVETAGYPTLTSPVVLRAGQTLDVGTLRLLRDAALTVARVEGVIRDTGGVALAGVTISITGAPSIQTDGDGRYLVNDVPPGAVTITATRSGFHAALGTTTLVAGSTVNFSPVLRAVTTEGFTVSGTFTDATTQQPLAGVNVELSGSAAASQTSDANGIVQITGLTPGNVRVVVSRAGYASRIALATVDGGQVLNVSAALTLLAPGAPETFSVSGRITDRVSGAPLAGVQVSVSGATPLSAQTDANGDYEITGLAPGSFTVTASATNYQAASASGTGVAYLSVDFSATLLPFDALPTGLRAIIADQTNGSPLEGAAVIVTHSGGSVSETTLPGGEFIARNLTAGLTAVSVSAQGYQSAQFSLTTAGGYINDLGIITLLPVTYSAPVTLTGRVLNSTNDMALTGVVIVVTTPTGTQSVQSGANGAFSVTVPAGQVAALEFAATTFVTSRFTVLVSPDDADLGQVRLRPDGLDSLLADLATLSVDAQLVNSTPSTYQVSGSVSVRLQNRGHAAAPASTVLVAFEDRNANGRVDAGEPEFGRVTLAAEFAAGTSRDVEIPVAGTASFRDAPVTVLADADQNVVERDETNNHVASVGSCLAPPPAASALAPRLKWHWRGSPQAPTDFEVFGPAMVGQLTDDNGDLVIDERDVPDAVFTTRQQRLTAISGDDGRTLWQTAPNMVTGLGSPALGDIDNDGLLEIVVSNGPRTQLLAFENTGTLKWTAVNGPQHTNTTRDGITIANIDGGEFPEVITGRRVYDGQSGTLKWTGTGDHGGYVAYGTLPIAVNLDRTGPMEVVAGRTAYRADGSIWWTAAARDDGLNAIGNFDADEFPEVVLITEGRLYLLQHTGEVIWGPITISGGGSRGGAPTVGDFDGDGVLDIGIAGSSRYTVYNADGSFKWSTVIDDASSFVTGSSLFDFDGNGSIEVVYADEQFLRIYNGANGAELYRIANGSETTFEYPVVADIDGDGRAELLVASNTGAAQGVRAFEGSAGEWMPTRAIWNQSTYHIDNVNDDGTIPLVEAEGWLTHNSYRANRAVPRQLAPVADLTAGAMRLVDNGIGQPASLVLRVGNAGAPLASGIATVSFFDGTAGGAPNGTLLGTAQIPALATGTYADVRLDGLPAVSPSGTLWAVVDPTARVTECDELNNTSSTLGRPAVGALAITTLAQYAPGAVVDIDASITNTGLFINDYRAELAVFDSAGNPLASLPGFDAPSLASGAGRNFNTPFGTSGLLDGVYLVRGTLFDSNNTQIATTERVFAIGHDATQGAAAALRVTTDRATYHTSDAVTIETLSRNLTTGTPFAGTQVRLAVTNPSGVTVLDTVLPVGQLMPSAARGSQHVMTLLAATPGSYSVLGTLENGTGQVLATGGDSFEVISDAAVALSGSVTLGARTVAAGEPLLCTRVVNNTGTTPLTDLPLRYIVARLSDGVAVVDLPVTVSIGAGGSHVAPNSVSTTELAGGDYACAVQARVNGTWLSLAHGVFSVTAPTVNIDATLALGGRGKLLALIDEQTGWPCTPMRKVELWAPFARTIPSSATVKVELFNSSGTRLDRESIKLSNYHGTVNANYGSTADVRITGLSSQILTVELASSSSLGSGYRLLTTVTINGMPPMILESNVMGDTCGWRAGLGAKFGDFEMSDGEATQHCDELPGPVPAIPSLAAQRAFLAQTLAQAGWFYTIVDNSTDFIREMRTGAYSHYALFAEHEKLDDQAQQELREAVFSGATLLDAGMHDRRHHSFDAALGITPNGKRPNATAVTFNVSWMPPGPASLLRTATPLRVTAAGAATIGFYNVSQSQGPIAITEYAYGLGKSAYVGYDLLGEATHAGVDSLHAGFLRSVMVELKPPPSPRRAGQVVSLELTLTNRAAATPGRATLTLPVGVTLLEADGAQVSGNELTWDFNLGLDDERVRTALVRLPTIGGALTFNAVVSAGTAPALVEQARPSLVLDVAARASYLDALNLAYANHAAFSPVAQWLEIAEDQSAAGRPAHALAALVQASYEAACSTHPLATTLRQMVDDLIWTTTRQVP